MKKIRKLLVLLLAASLTLCATAIIASAEGDAVALTESEIKSLVELYDGGVYYAEDFEAGLSIRSDSDIADKSGVVKGIVEKDGGNVVELVGAPSANEDVSIIASSEEQIDGFVFSTRIMASGGVLNVYANGNNDAGDELGSILLVSLSFSPEDNGVYVHTVGNYGMADMTKLDGVSLVADAWYNISVVYNTAEASYALTIEQLTDNAGVALEAPTVFFNTYDAVITELFGATAAVAGSTIADKTIYLDDIYFYEGATVYDLSAEEKKLGAAMELLMQSLDTATDSEKAEIIDMLNVIVVKRALVADGYMEAKKLATLKIAEYYVSEYVKLVDAYNSGDLYRERAAAILAIQSAHDLIPEIPTYTEEENAESYTLMLNVIAELGSAETEYGMISVRLATLASQSEAFIKYMSDKDRTNNTYSTIVAWVDDASKFDFDPTYYVVNDVNGVETVTDIAPYLSDYLHLVAKATLMKSEAIAFIGYVNVMANADNSFIDRYNAYAKASKIRFLDVEYTFVDEAAGKLSDAVALYEETVDDIIEVERICSNFISAIADAKTATDISNLNMSLAKAEKYDMVGDDENKIHLELTYPGVVDAIADYNALCLRREDEQKRANDFIAAVDAVRAATDTVALKAAIEIAGSIIPYGILNGYEGYSDALSYFLSVESNLLYNETYVERFIEIVFSLNSLECGKEKYDAIVAAQESYAKIIDATAGVAEVKAILDATIMAYDAEMAEANTAFVEVVNETAKIASAAAPTDAYLRVVAVLKKIFE